MSRMLLLAGAAVLVAATGAFAHHSYSATYDTSRTVTLEGKLVQFVFKNPHSFVTVQAADDKGMTLAQVKAAKPSADFDGRYGVFPGAQTGDSFIEAVYRSLQEKK